jgi:hypothetical protein
LTDGDIAAYWTTLRVFTKKLGVLLEELERGEVWRMVQDESPWLTSEVIEPHEEITEVWAMALHSTTNTRVALLKVPLGFDTRLEEKISRKNLNVEGADSPGRLRLARNLLGFARELLADFDALSRGPAV